MQPRDNRGKARPETASRYVASAFQCYPLPTDLVEFVRAVRRFFESSLGFHLVTQILANDRRRWEWKTVYGKDAMTA